MSDLFQTAGKSPFQVNLDEEVVFLPAKSLEAMVSMFSHFDKLGLRRALSSSSISGGSDVTGAPPMSCQSRPGQQVSFRALGRQVVCSARGQIEVLQSRLDELQFLVLINNWTTVERLWSEALPHCKTPLVELKFIEELWGVIAQRLGARDWSLARHEKHLVLIQAKVELILARQHSLLDLSDTLERDMGHWLKQLEKIFKNLDEKSLP